jgi:cob(I)alamin adenosyltransferase
LRISERQVTWVEEKINSLNAHLAPLDSFALPGGATRPLICITPVPSCGEPERYMTEIAYQEPVNPAALRYANRLSHLLFVLAVNLTQSFWLVKHPDDYSLLPINTCFAAASSLSFSLLTFG